MRDRLIPCDGSDFAFYMVHEGREWVSRMYYQGEPLHVEFRERTPELLKLAMAEWLARLATRARALQ